MRQLCKLNMMILKNRACDKGGDPCWWPWGTVIYPDLGLSHLKPGCARDYTSLYSPSQTIDHRLWEIKPGARAESEMWGLQRPQGDCGGTCSRVTRDSCFHVRSHFSPLPETDFGFKKK